VKFDLRYPGQVFDEETGLSYNLHRYYDAATGRHMQADPIGLEGGWNRFGYANGNPKSFVDPIGLLFLDLTTFESAKRGVALNEAIQRGDGFRNIGGPIILGAMSAPIVGGIGVEAAAGFAACYRVPQTLYHFTTREAYQKIIQDGLMRVGVNNLYGPGVYATRFNNGFLARLQGASSAEAKIVIQNTAPFRSTPFPGTFRTQGTPVPLK
jgi:RHS repeat-associated protein